MIQTGSVSVRTLLASTRFHREIRMRENPSAGQCRDLSLHNDWFVSGWEHVLPRQALALTMLMGTASQPGATGSLGACGDR
jgi:hypothetical protein